MYSNEGGTETIMNVYACKSLSLSILQLCKLYAYRNAFRLIKIFFSFALTKYCSLNFDHSKRVRVVYFFMQ